MKRFATFFVSLGLATAGSMALAEQAKDQVSKQDAKPQPVQMTEQQLDNVAAGALVNVIAFDVVDVRNVDVLRNANVNVPVQAQVGILAAQAAGSAINNARDSAGNPL